MLQAYISSVSGISDVCFRHVSSVSSGVTKVDLDVAYTCMLQAYVFKYFIRMLQVFYLDVAYVCNGFQAFFRCSASVSDVCYKCFSCYERIFVSVLDVKKIDLVLHMLQWDPPPQPPVVAVEAPPSGRRLSRGMHVGSGGGASSPRVQSDNTGPRMGA
jgi:hypothetical protein